MSQELVCHHILKKKKHYLSLDKPIYRIGKALDNDIILLDAEVPLYWASLEKNPHSYAWNPQGHQVIGKNGRYQCGNYLFYVSSSAFWFKLIALLGCILFSAVGFHHLKKQLLPQVLNNTLPARGTYGNNDPKIPVRSIAFEFQSNLERYSVLHYTSGNVIEPEDIQVRVNGEFLAFVQASPNRWNVEQKAYIPKDKLNLNNKLEFIFEGKEVNRWAIKNIYIEELNEAPLIQNGAEMLKNAEKLFRERNMRRGNLIRAQQAARAAGQFYYSRREVYPEALQRVMQKIQTEKSRMIDEHRMLIQKLKQQGDGNRASRVYRRLMNELIDPMDPDRNQIIREYERGT